MAHKLAPDSGPRDKALGIYCLLLFSGQQHSLSQLAARFQCAKSTVTACINQIEKREGERLVRQRQGKELFFSIPQPEKRVFSAVTAAELRVLSFCRDVVWQWLPAEERERLEAFLQRTAFGGDSAESYVPLRQVAGTALKGYIDYTPFQESVSAVLEAIRHKQMLHITYQGLEMPAPKTYPYCPAQVAACREALYVRGWRMTEGSGGYVQKHICVA